MKKILSIIISATFVVSGYAQTRNVLVGTNNAVVQPTNFWSADASNARSGLGLGTAATSPASAFQPSSATLSNLAAGAGSSLTNLTASSIVGTLSIGQGGTGATNATDARASLGLGTAATNPVSAFQSSSSVLSNVASSNAINLTNLRITNLVGTLSVASGGTGATNASGARTSLELGTAATNPATAFQPSSVVLSNLASSNAVNLTNIRATNIVGVIPSSNIPTVSLTNIGGMLAVSSGGTGATNAGGARTNLGLGALNDVVFNQVIAIGGVFSDTNPATDLVLDTQNYALYAGGILTSQWDGSEWAFNVPFRFVGTNASLKTAQSRTNLGLGWSALTNTNAGTSLVSVNTSGDVVSPTNFWQVAPINTRVQTFAPSSNETNNATNARNLFVYSLGPNIINTTNTIALPTNPATTFEGDVATITHLATNVNSVTAIRALGGTNLIILNKSKETVRFIYRGSQWRLAETPSFNDPIYFSGTNAVANAAASVTNLFNPNTPIVFNTNGQVVYNGTNVLTFTNNITFNSPVVHNEDIYADYIEFSSSTNFMELRSGGIVFGGTAAATTRTNLGVASKPIWAYKATNQSNSTTILTNDSALSFTAAPNTKYAVELFLIVDNSDIDLEVNIATNAQAIGWWTYYEIVNGIVVPTTAPVTLRLKVVGPDGGGISSTKQSFVVVGATNTNSTVRLRFASGISNNTTVIVAGSYLRAEVIE